MTRDEIILNNRGIVGYVIKKMGLINQFDELFDLGLIGLIKAADTWDKSKCTFMTYAYACVRNEIGMYMRKQKYQTISLETPITDNLKLEDTIKDDYNFEEEIIENDLIVRIKKEIINLNSKEQECLIRYFGLFGFKKQTMMNIAKHLNISQSYVTRIIQKAIKKRMVVNQ